MCHTTTWCFIVSNNKIPSYPLLSQVKLQLFYSIWLQEQEGLNRLRSKKIQKASIIRQLIISYSTMLCE